MSHLSAASQSPDLSKQALSGKNSSEEKKVQSEANMNGSNGQRRNRRRNGPRPRMNGNQGYPGRYSPFFQRGPYIPPFMYNRRFGRPPRMNGPNPRRGNLYSFLGNVDKSKLDPEHIKKADHISTTLLTLKPPVKPLTAFQTFVNEKRKDDEKLPIAEIQKVWKGLSEKERDEKTAKAWNARQEFNAGRKDFLKKRLELLNELRLVQGKPEIVPREPFVRGFDLYWKDMEKKVAAEMPGATAYDLQQKRVELWKKLTKDEKNVYIVQSLIEREKVAHERRLAILGNRMKAAKDTLAASAVAVKSA